MIFRQLVEPLSNTYTYVLGCEATGLAILIDPVIATMDRDLTELQVLGLKLAYTVDTHIHADHITAALELKKKSAVGLPRRPLNTCLVPTPISKKASHSRLAVLF